MRVIILAAGQSRRYQQAGYKIPKPFLKVDWNGVVVTMLEHVINTIPSEFDCITIAVPPGYDYFPVYNSKGPADTFYRVLQKLILPDSFLVLDTDILNSTNDLMKLTKLNHCGVLVRRSANPSYSYVDRLGAFQHIKEKERISEYAVQGAYFVPKSALDEFMIELKRVVETVSEPFMSHVFDRLTLEKYSVPTTYIPVDWGTPKDLEMSGAHIMSDREG